MNPILAEIRDVRQANNDLWMALVEVALQTAPEHAKAILRDIRKNDVKVSELMGRLSE